MEIHAVNIRAKRVLPFHSDADIFSRIAACEGSQPRVDGQIDRPTYQDHPLLAGKRDASGASVSGTVVLILSLALPLPNGRVMKRPAPKGGSP